MAYSALGFSITCFLQARASNSLALLYVADLVDGVSSCMNNVCQAYVADASPPEKRAVRLGVFMGLSVAGAFILGMPLSAVLASKYGLRAPMYAAAGVGLLNFAIITLLVPESLPPAQRKAKVEWRQANPLGALKYVLAYVPAHAPFHVASRTRAPRPHASNARHAVQRAHAPWPCPHAALPPPPVVQAPV